VPLIGSVIGTLTIRGSTDQVRHARKFVGRLLAERLDCDTAVLLTSEIVTNAILHSRSSNGGEVVITVLSQGQVVRVEVRDHGSDKVSVPCPRAEVSDLDDSGRGLLIVEELASSWGCDHGADATVTWFELNGAARP